MSDILKKFKSVFIVEDESGSSENTSTPPTNAQQHPAEMTAPPSRQRSPEPAPASATIATTGSVSDKFVEILAAALEKNNQDGFDYFEFRQALKNLSKMPMDEATRFHSAYAMAQTMGITPAKLVESAQFYLNVLTNEQAKFNEAHAQQRARHIGNREEEVKNLEAMIQNKAEQIKQLTLQIEAHRQRSETIRKEINESTVKVENTKADFEATFTSVTGHLKDDIRKMQEYLK